MLRPLGFHGSPPECARPAPPSPLPPPPPSPPFPPSHQKSSRDVGGTSRVPGHHDTKLRGQVLRKEVRQGLLDMQEVDEGMKFKPKQTIAERAAIARVRGQPGTRACKADKGAPPRSCASARACI